MNFLSKIDRSSKDFKGLPFWSWNDQLKEEELRRQIRHMKENGFGGFFMHARGGLKTEYCSKEWYDCINACVDEAKKLGMEAWAYDENGWPSGFAGGKLLKDPANWVPALSAKQGAFDPAAFASYKIDENNVPHYVKSAEDGTENYLNIYRKYIPCYVDIMDEAIVKKFIEATHEEYKKQVGDEFGKTMPGFFTDEPQYYRYETPWSDTFLTTFEAAYGYSVFEALPSLFLRYDGDMEKRYDYWLLCHKQYTNGFAKQIYSWCEANGVQLTGHTIEECNLSWQMACSGGVMSFYEYEHIPGMDHLTRRIGGDLAPKQVGSVAAQLNKKQTLTETFALCGWDVNPMELKRIAQWQFVGGINRICAHLYPYSERGERKYDYPCHYSDHLPWTKDFAGFNDYFARLGAALSMGKENARVLVIHPMHSAYLYYLKNQPLERLDNALSALLSDLGSNGIQYHLGDELIMARHAKVRNGKMIVGACTYDTVLLPKMDTLDASTVTLLKKFMAQGGSLAAYGSLPTRIDGKKADLSFLKPNKMMDDLKAEREAWLDLKDNGLRINVRQTKQGRLFYLVNLAEHAYPETQLHIKNAKGLVLLDLINKREIPVDYSVSGDVLTLPLTFAYAGSFVLLEKEASADHTTVRYGQPIVVKTDAVTLKEKPENCLVLDYAQISADGVHFEPLRYIKHVHELLLRRKTEGTVSLKFPFTIKDKPKTLKLCVEPLKDLIITVNGQEVSLTDEWRLDRSFHLADIASAIKKGKNSVVLTFTYHQDQHVYDVLFNDVMESLRNSLALDTEIEALYLFADFGVVSDQPFSPGKNGSDLNEGKFTIVKRDKTVNAHDLVQSGYPFFTGSVRLELPVTVPEEGDYHLSVPGRYAVGRVYVNHRTTSLFFEHECIVHLNKGANKLTLTLTNALRNTFGPLHHSEDESYAVGPFSFTLENTWSEKAVSPHYRERYAFMRFGIDDLVLTKIEK